MIRRAIPGSAVVSALETSALRLFSFVPTGPVRRLTLLVMVYVALDFANPMMPGAVQFVHGCLETVAGCGLRGGEVPTPIVTMSPRHARQPVAPAPSASPSGPRIVSVSPPVPSLFRAPFEPSRTSPPTLDDH